MTDRSEATPDELGFAGCLAELDAIVRGLESDTIDVDDLTAKVERASDLVEWCRARLSTTRLRVHEVLERLDHPVDAEIEAAADGDRAGDDE